MVTIVGAGFAGLTLAHELLKLGVEFKLFERESRAGGRLQTVVRPEGLVETAANALLNDQNVDELFRELGLARAVKLPGARKRYIFWNEPRRWPLTLKTSARFATNLARLKLGAADLKPRAGESVREWGERFVNAEFVDRLLAPGLRGVYAGEPERLSASLTVGALFGERPPRADVRGSVAPALGMGALIQALRDRLGERLVTHAFEMPERLRDVTVVCASAWEAARLLKTAHPKSAEILGRCESLALTSTTCFYEPDRRELNGFGCLFPARQDFHSLGVLFNTDIFAGRGNYRSETWISRGAEFNESTHLEQIAEDRARLQNRHQKPIATHITRWPRAVPYYTVEWEAALKTLAIEPPLYLHGNYLGRLGLAQILMRSKRLAQTIKDQHEKRID